MVYNIACAGCEWQSALYHCCCYAATVLLLLCCCSCAVAELLVYCFVAMLLLCYSIAVFLRCVCYMCAAQLQIGPSELRLHNPLLH